MAKFNVIFKEEFCKGCGLCTLYCPMKIVFLEKDRINSKGYNIATVKEIDKCIGCTNCALICPDSVITIEKE